MPIVSDDQTTNAQLADKQLPGELRNKAKWYCDRFKDADESRKPNEETWLKNFRAWVGEVDFSDRDEDEAKLSIPMVFRHAETLYPSYAAALFGPDVMSCRPIDKDGDPIQCELVQRFVRWQLNEATDYVEEGMDAVHAAVILNTAYLATGIAITDEYNRQLATQFYVDPLDLWIEPGARRLRTARWCVHRQWLTADELRARTTGANGQPLEGVNQEVYDLLDEINPSPQDDTNLSTKKWQSQMKDGAGDSKHPQNDYDSRENQYGPGSAREHKRQHEGPLLTLWFWEKQYSDTGDPKPAKLTVLVEDEFLLWENTDGLWEHKKLPFAELVWTPNPARPQGLGVAETLQTLQDEINFVHMSQADATNLAIAPMLLNGQGGKAIKEEFKVGAGAIIAVSDPEHVRQLEFNGRQLPFSYEFARVLDAVSDETVGAHAVQRGNMEGMPDATSHGTEAVVSKGNLRQGQVIKRMMRALKRVLEQIVAINKVHTKPETVRRILGADPNNREWLQQNPKAEELLAAYEEDPKGRNIFDVTDIAPIVAPALGNEALHRTQKLQLLEVISGVAANVPEVSQRINWVRLLGSIVESFDESTLGVFFSREEAERRAAEAQVKAARMQATVELYELMMTGKMDPPQPGQLHIVHLQVHAPYASDPELAERFGFTPEHRTALHKHIEQTISMAKAEADPNFSTGQPPTGGAIEALRQRAG